LAQAQGCCRNTSRAKLLPVHSGRQIMAGKAVPQVIMAEVKGVEGAVNDDVVIGVVIEEGMIAQEKTAAAVTEPKKCRCLQHVKMVIALAVGTIALLAVGIYVGFALGGQRGDKATAVEEPKEQVIQGRLLLSVQDADGFLLDSRTSEALSLSIAEVSGVEADMVRIDEISKVERRLRGNERRLAQTSVEVDYSLLLGKDVDAEALEAQLRDVRPESLGSALDKTMQEMGMESVVEVTMMQVEAGAILQEADEPSSEGTLDGHLHSPEGHGQDQDRKWDGDITEAGEHSKPHDGNQTVEDGKEGHDGNDRPFEHGKPGDGNQTVEDGKDGHDGNDRPFEHSKPHDGNQTVEDGKEGHDGNGRPFEHGKPGDGNQTVEDGKEGHDGNGRPFEHGKPGDGNQTVEDGKKGHDGNDRPFEHGKPGDGNQTVEDGQKGHDGNDRPFEHGKPRDGNQTVEDGKEGHDGNDRSFEQDKPADSESGHAGQHGHRNGGEDGHGLQNGSHRGPQHGSHSSPGGQ